MVAQVKPAVESRAEYIRRTVDAMPPLSQEQFNKLRALVLASRREVAR